MLSRLLVPIILLSLTMVNPAQAHDDNLATLHISRISDDQWVFQVMTPLNKLDQSTRAFMLNENMPSADIATHSNEYKRAVVAYIKEKFDVSAWGVDNDGTPVQGAHLILGAGRMQLDEHMSVLAFEIKGMPDTISGLDFHLAYMSENATQNNSLRLINGDRNQRYILNFKNNFSGIDTHFFAAENR